MKSTRAIAIFALFLGGIAVGGLAVYGLRGRAIVPTEPGRVEMGTGYRAQATIVTAGPSGYDTRTAVISGDRSCRMIAVDGLDSTLIDDGARLVLADPDGGYSVLGPSEEAPLSPDLPDTYRAEVAAGPLTAGRPTQRLEVVEGATGETVLRIDRDDDTGVTLRRVAYRNDGALASSTEVTSIEYGVPGPELPPGLPTSETADAPMDLAEFIGTADFTPHEPAWVPEGYTLQGFYGHPCEHGRWYAEYRYSDTLRTLAVYERHPQGGGGGRGPGEGRGRHGFMGGAGGADGGGRGRGGGAGSGRPQVIDHGIAFSLRQRRGDLVVLVTGDLAVDEVMRVLESVPEG